jgi:hypothetical protein
MCEWVVPAEKFLEFLFRDKLAEIGHEKGRARSVGTASHGRRSRSSGTGARSGDRRTTGRSGRSRSLGHLLVVVMMVVMRRRSH